MFEVHKAYSFYVRKLAYHKPNSDTSISAPTLPTFFPPSLASIVANTEPAKIEVRLQGLSSSVQETVAADLENQLSDLKSKIGRIPSPTPPPRTTLQIQDDAATERAWQN